MTSSKVSNASFFPLVSVILPTFNRHSILSKSIESIIYQKYSNLEIIIINDASSDSTAEVLEKFSRIDERVKGINNITRLGLPESRNRGISLSSGSLIFFSEDDLFLERDCISRLVESFHSLDQSYKLGAVGPRLINVPKRLNKQEKIITISPLTKDIHCNFELTTSNVVEVDLLHSCSIFSKTTLRLIGGYERKLYKGSYSREETDLYLRLRRQNYRLFFEPHAVAYHYSGALGGCILPSLSLHEYYNIRNHLFFSIRFYGVTTLLSFPVFIGQFLLRRLQNRLFRKTPR